MRSRRAAALALRAARSSSKVTLHCTTIGGLSALEPQIAEQVARDQVERE